MEAPISINIKNILVVGAGAMGSQIAMTSALSGYKTAVQDVSEAQLSAAKVQLQSRVESLIRRGKLSTDEASRAFERLQLTTDLASAAEGADFVIEAATERLDVKREIFGRLGELTPRHAILSTNSSTLGSSHVAEASGRPEQLCNMHFFNPVLVMECVEIVRNPGTSQATVDTVIALARAFGKQPVLLNKEVPGFVANRLMGAIQREAIALLGDGVASLEDIDTTAKAALRHPMGPFELMDLVGLDVINDIDHARYQESADPLDKPSEAVLALVEAGKLGRKSGEGWYRYES